jgi:short-subunit dehydrogenase involved in D-alanine esterification of teichoic acids
MHLTENAPIFVVCNNLNLLLCDYKGNKIIVTGATSGIGEALAKKFVGLNNEVIAIGRNAQKLEKLGKT